MSERIDHAEEAKSALLRSRAGTIERRQYWAGVAQAQALVVAVRSPAVIVGGVVAGPVEHMIQERASGRERAYAARRRPPADTWSRGCQQCHRHQ